MDSLLATSTIESIGIFINDYSFWSTFIIAAAFFVRGEIATLLSVYLIQQGLIGWPKILLIGILSIAFQDVVVYYIGRYGQKTKLGAYLESKFRGAEKLKNYLHKNTTKALILTKFTVGFGSLTIMMSGWSKINFKKFLKINIIA
ncbi:MAG: VTT domain-containing protein, partial [Candidatus Paceibacterota bacterium]